VRGVGAESAKRPAMAMRFIALHYTRKIANAARGPARGIGTAPGARYTGGAAPRRRRNAIHFHAEAT